ncbi:MAG: LPS-assembly protein LptD [Candidatus Omnitrophica bacterium]|nr:LPS-assembly protein LptD [Candidatus Omnitrophota bacterium]
MYKKTLISITIILFSILPHAYAQKDATPIVVNGDKVQYDNANKKVAGSGNVSITYQDIKMTCDEIIVDVEAKRGTATGDVTLYQEDSVFKADHVIYDFENKTGDLVNGGMRMIPWYGNAKTIEKIEDKLFKLNDSHVTTCEFDEPHYRIEAKTIKVYMGDRVTAWHVFFYVGDVPVMYFPYYNHPLEDDLPQVTVVPGRNSEWGTYLLTAWRYYFHPDSKGHVHLDWRSRRGFAHGVDYKYGMRKFGKGYFRFYYLHDKEPDESQELGTSLPSERWRAQLRHKWNVDNDTVMAGEYHKVSDHAFIKDFFYKDEFEKEDQPQTYLMLTGARDNYTFTYLVNKKVNDFFTVVERLPEAKLHIRSLKLLDNLNLYYENESSAVRLSKKYEKDLGRFSTPTDNYDALRFDSFNKLFYPFRLFGFLNVNPFVAARETFYSEDADGHDNVTRDIFKTGVDLYTRFYKIYDVETNYLDLDIHKLRHLIIPQAKYTVLPTPSIKRDQLHQFDEIDNKTMSNAIELTLQHKLQTKRRTDDGGFDTHDLVTFIADTDFIIRDEKDNDFELSDIVEHYLEISPYDWMSVYFDAIVHRRKKRIDVFNADLNIRESEDTEFSVGYRYEKHENSQVTAYWTNHINRHDWKKHWAFEIYERYEIQEKQFQEQQYTLIKDLHCWTAEMTCRVKEQRDFTFWVIFRLKAFPDMPFYFRTTYQGPDPGRKRK